MGSDKFIEKVSNAIDLESSIAEELTQPWKQAAAVVVKRCCAAVAEEEGAALSVLAADALECSTSSSTESEPSADAEDGAAEAALRLYPVPWHTAEPLIESPTVPTQFQPWHMYTDCGCNGQTRYFMCGSQFAGFMTPLINSRPPCCFTKAFVTLDHRNFVQIVDEEKRLLAYLGTRLPNTLKQDTVTRDPEERMMTVLAQNIWWIAHEHCREIHVEIAQPHYKPAKSCYSTQLALPSVLVQKTSLRDYCAKLQNVYTHVQIILKD